MKKILLSLSIIMGSAAVFAQTSWHEGHVNYKISVTGNDQMAQMMDGSTMDISVKDSLSKMDMNTSMMQTHTIMNNIAKKGTMLMEVMGNKYAIPITPGDIKSQEEASTGSYEVKYIDSTKAIAGHVCNKAIVSIKKDKKELTLWYAPDITIPIVGNNMYSKIKGLPLEYEIEQGPIDLKFICTLIDNTPVDASIFAIPDGYQTMSMDDFKNAMGGMGGH